MYEAFLGFRRGLIDILHGKGYVPVQKLAGMGIHAGDSLLGLQFVYLIFQLRNLQLQFIHFILIGRAFGNRVAHGQLQQLIGLVPEGIQFRFFFLQLAIDFLELHLRLENGVSDGFYDDALVPGCALEIIDYGLVESSRG
ncbi:MAG: hypothetical protein A2Y00_05365 [Omnitrophica WOR_2 bacterium GWF2_43_52]|nr:MAG: hypothetical protein A2Y01_02110 [Omnitrophica WOR_2 bacterium GWC2_44_8]OGX20528.1 MAG: hypothetical protein A2Y00_05365 [Omnitrophica WOR_2 bacterium GWF2_43_52]HAH21654.1 hypothetical protein [Candidatus Omnitrophota bacterium]HBG64247.1 hypothetical protein [Candidatus Omnitrophota bacterium]HCD38039.1 hypothetical protein [Candidatus Omnitrophota bacterium]